MNFSGFKLLPYQISLKSVQWFYRENTTNRLATFAFIIVSMIMYILYIVYVPNIYDILCILYSIVYNILYLFV